MQRAEMLPACCRVLPAAAAYYAHKGLSGLRYCLVCHLLVIQAVCSAFVVPSELPVHLSTHYYALPLVRRPACHVASPQAFGVSECMSEAERVCVGKVLSSRAKQV